jgi:hypothetical protein
MIALALMIASAASGLVATYYWYHSARFQAEDDPTQNGPPETIRRAILDAINAGFAILSAQDNRKAAVWTATAVLLGAASGIISLLWHPHLGYCPAIRAHSSLILRSAATFVGR